MSEAVLAAVIVGSVTLLAAVVTGLVTLRNERERRSVERESVEQREMRSTVAEAFRRMFAMQHEIEWITWHAANDPPSLGSEMARDYSRVVHATYPELLGAMAVVASLDLDLYHELKPLADKIYKLDGQVALAARGLSDPALKQQSVAELASLSGEALNLYEVLPEQMASSMRVAGAMSSGK